MITSPAWCPRRPSTATASQQWGENPTASTVRQTLRNGSLPEKGVSVSQQDGRLIIALHIKVGYGLNIASITQSITHRVQDEVERATGLKVARIDVYVDDILAD